MKDYNDFHQQLKEPQYSVNISKIHLYGVRSLLWLLFYRETRDEQGRIPKVW